MKKSIFQDATVIAARNQYAALLEQLTGDRDAMESVLEGHASSLGAMVERQGGLVRSIIQENPGTHTEALKTFRTSHRRLSSAAGDAIKRCYAPSDKTLDKLRNAAAEIKDALSLSPEQIDAVATSDAYLKRIYAQSRPETRERYQRMDFLFGVGQDFVFGEPEIKKLKPDATSEEKAEVLEKARRDRMVNMLCMPEELRVARWRYMLALADRQYDIGLTDNRTNGMDDHAHPTGHHKLELFSRLFAHLSLHPRGVDNECMPGTHQLRHNPAIHSLHTTALADKFFSKVEQHIKTNGNGNATGLKHALHKIRRQVMMAALVHDLGESFGELSTGSKMSEMPESEKASFSASRNPIEDAVFVRQLDRMKALMDKQHGKTAIASDDWQRIRKELTDAYHLAESHTFTGRFFKILERMQSQQDYLRFHGKNGASQLSEAKEENKRFTLNYVPSLLYGTQSYRPHAERHDHSLRELVQRESDRATRDICGWLCDAVEREYNGPERYDPSDKSTYPGLNRQLAEAIGVRHLALGMGRGRCR